ncbi:ribosome-associated translation inhibitor RaiA [bacterium]|nr:ribosome-associated translation inhibitor RaiA [bacterium]MBU1599072.1 ribosome-associated translation inhibitor RaiA [bacterium]
MEFSIDFRDTKGIDLHKIEDYAKKKMKGLERYSKKGLIFHVVISHQKGNFSSEIIINGENHTIQSKADATDVKLAIDKCLDKAKRQLVKIKEKVSNHKKIQHLPEALIKKPEPEKAIRKRKANLPYLSIEQAKEELLAKKASFLLFIDSETEEKCLLHPTKDKRYELLIF